MNNEMPVNNLFEPGGKGLRWGQEEVDREPQSPLLCRSVFPQPPSAHFLYFPWSSLHFGRWGGGGWRQGEKAFKKNHSPKLPFYGRKYIPLCHAILGVSISATG